MSCSIKIPLNNGIGCPEAQWIRVNSVMETSVKLAGEEAKDRLYEPKHKKKLVRVLTVIAYVFFVSLAAIMLSLYYVFLWNGNQKMTPKYAMQRQVQANCDHMTAAIQQEIAAMINEDLEELPSTTTTTEDNATWSDYDLSSEIDYVQSSSLMKKLMYNKYPVR